MSILTHLLETTPHFGHAIEEAEQKLKISELPAVEKSKLLVELAYCYAHVQLQKGEAAGK
jgi:hypothetical protein